MRPYLRLLRYARPYWRGWLGIVVVTLLSTAFSLLQPWPMKILVDYVLGDKPVPGFVGHILGSNSPDVLVAAIALSGLVVFAFNSALDLVLTFAWIRVGQRMVYDLARDLFDTIQRRSLVFHTRHPVGDSMSRITQDSWSVHTIVDTLLFAPGHSLIMGISMIVIMLQLNTTLTLLAVVVAPLMMVSSLLLGRPIRVADRERREAESRIYSHIQQTLTGMPVVQVFNQEAREHGRLREYARSAIAANRRKVLVSNLGNLGPGLSSTLGRALILWFGARQVLSGDMTVGTLLLFLTYFGSLHAQLSAFTGIYTALQGVRGSTDRVMEVLDADPEVVDKPDAEPLPRIQGAVALENVTFGYEPGTQVLHDVSLAVEPGETLALVGPTGAGKSTLAALVPRLFDPWEGRVLVDGHDLRDVQLGSLRSQVAVVLQEAFLFPLSVAENIAYGRPEASREEIEAAARAANAHTFIMEMSDGYDTVLGERGATLSGGQRQRLSIARALLKDAPLLILDEPTSALDAETEAMLLEALERLMQGRTTLIIAHRLSTIRRADRVAVLEGGRLVEYDTAAALLAQDGLFARLHRLQFGDTAKAKAGAS
jgi:ATP-binding cassette subfamily B protein